MMMDEAVPLYKEWKNFVISGMIEPSVRPLVAKAWWEAKASGLAGNEPPKRICLNPIMIEEVLAKEKELVETIRHRMRRFTEIAERNEEILFFLFNKQGILLDHSTDQEHPILRRLGLTRGLLAGFPFHGHTAFSLALKEKKEAYLQGGEHFLSVYHPYSTYAVPLIHPQKKEIMGVLGALIPHYSSPEDHLRILLSLKRGVEESFRLRLLSTDLALIHEEIFHALDHLIVIVGPDGRIIDVNQPFTGIFEGKLPIGLTAKEFVETFAHLPYEESYLYRGVALREEGVNLERWVTIAGKRRCYLIDILIMDAPSDPSQHWTIEILKDITARKEMDEQWARQEKMVSLGRLAAGIAHEIRNPLTTAKGFIQLLKDKTPYHEYFHLVEKELNRISELVTQFVLLSKPDSPHLSSHSISSLLHHFLEFIQPEATLKGIEVELSLPVESEKWEVDVDADHMFQVFINLAQNAFQAMNEGGRLIIEVAPFSPGMVEIRFTDEGNGIPQPLLDKVVEPFFTTKEERTGLGLTICHQIVETHGGKMELESAEGTGTTVRIRLPFIKKERFPSTESPALSSEARALPSSPA